MHTQDQFLEEINLEPRLPIPRRYQTPRGSGAEAMEVKRRLEGFDAAASPVSRLLRDCFPNATKNEIISIAQMTILVAHERLDSSMLPESFDKFDRVVRRSRELIIKWYHDHWKIIAVFFGDIGLADSAFNTISKNSQYLP